MRKNIEERINAGLISAHHACTDRINQIKFDLDQRKEIQHELYTQESWEYRKKIMELNNEIMSNSRMAQAHMMMGRYDEASKCMDRNKKIPEIVKVYKDLGQKAVQKYTVAVAKMELEAGKEISYLSDIDTKLQDRIYYNSTYMVDYLYSMYNLTLGHDGFYNLWKPYRYKPKVTSEKDDVVFDSLFKWYMPKEQADYIFDELYKWDVFNPVGICQGGAYDDPDPYMKDTNSKVFCRMVEELINDGKYFTGKTIS